MRRTIRTDRAPKAIGPYSQAVACDGWLWISMQLPLDSATGAPVEGDVAAQARRVLENVRAVAEAGGASLGSVVRATLYLADFADFAAVNEVFAEFFPDDPPARAALQPAALPKGARVAVDAVARVG